MRGFFRCIFIGVALLAGSGLRGWCATPEFIDSLRTELERRNMVAHGAGRYQGGSTLSENRNRIG